MSTRTVEANGYEFTVDSVTGTTIATGEIQNETASRNNKMQVQAGDELRMSTDQGGHLVAASHNGPAIRENLFAQDGHLNQGQFKTIENAERRLVSNTENPVSIYTERTAYMSHPQQEKGVRPDAFMINDTITYADGSKQEVHLSFANMTVEQQENINQELGENVDMENIPNPGDTLRENMSAEEYADLMEKTDTELPGLKEEFEEHITNDNLQSMDVTMEVDAMEATDITNSNSADWDFDSSVYGNEADVSDSWDCGAECDAGVDGSSADAGADSSPGCDND